ncbi:MAG: YidC/Oxa1 family membrane protein insertase [Patescibacteria group bacterium]
MAEQNPSTGSGQRKYRQLLEFALIFAAIYILSQFAIKTFFPEKFGGKPPLAGVSLSAQDPTIKGGHHPVLVLKNATDRELPVSDRCPAPPVDVYFSETGEPVLGEPLTAETTALPCTSLLSLPAGGQAVIDLAPWKYSVFGRFGEYLVRLELPEGFEQKEAVARFFIHEAGPITKIFRTFITKPFLNFLIFVASLLPDHNLGIAIIVLTLLVKIALYFPTQHALQGQKEMQKLQPKLDAIKSEFKNDPQRMQQETMKLWKEHKVNPFQSCLPMLIQFPILIGLFYTIRDGSVLALSRHLIYGAYQDLPWTFNTNFLGLDLLKPNLFIVPALLMTAQFVQLKLSFAINDRKRVKKEQEKKEDGKKEMSPQKMQQNVMLYGLPIMIGAFAFQFPAAVSLYWGISTLFAIVQQIVVNRASEAEA